MSTDNKYVNVRELPELSDLEPPNFSVPTDLSFGIDGVTFMTIANSDRLEMEFDFSGINRQFQLLAVDKKSQVEQHLIGEQFVRATEVVWTMVNGPARPAPHLSIQPAIAAVTGAAVDRNNVQAIQAVNSLFVSGNEPKMTTRDTHWLRKLSSGRPDPTRFFFRLAQMYYYYKQLEADNDPARPRVATAAPVHVNSIASVIATLRSACGGNMYVPFDLDIYTGDPATAVTILSYAAEGSPFPFSQTSDVSSILTADPGLPHLDVLLTGSSAPNIVNPVFSASEIWDVAYTLAGQLGVIEIANEMFHFVSTMLYSPYKDRDGIFRANQVRFSLPPLRMEYYGIFPVCIAADSIISAPYKEEIETHRQAAVLTFRSQLLSIAYKDVLWALGVGGAYHNSVHAARAARWRSNLLTKGRRLNAPLWGIMSAYLSEAGCAVSISEAVASLIPGKMNLSDVRLSDALDVCSSWIDVVDMVPKAPAAAVAAYVNPKKSKTLVQPGQRYKLDTISVDNTPSVVAALQSANAKFEILHKNTRALNWKISPLTPFSGKYGMPPDRPLPTINCDRDTSSVIVATIPTAADAIKLFNNDLRRKEWKWYISGTSEEPHGDSFAYGLGPNPSPVDPSGGPFLDPVPEGGSDDSDDEGLGPTAMGTPEQKQSKEAATAVSEMATIIASAKQSQAKAPAAPTQLPRQENWTYNDLMKAAPGIMRQAAGFYKDAVLMQANQPGRGLHEHMTPLIAPIASALENISFVQAVSAVPRKERVAVANAASRALQKLASTTKDQKIAGQLCMGAQRALNTAKALKQCSAINTTELAEDDMAWNEDAATVIAVLGDAMIEGGMSLADLAGPKPVGVDTRVAQLEEISELEGQGWRRKRDQSDAAAGEVAMYRPKKAVLPEASFEGASALLMDSVAEVEAKAKAMLDELMQSEAPDPVPEPEEPPRRSVRVVDLPPGEEEADRVRQQEQREAADERRRYEIQLEQNRRQLEHFKHKEASYTNPARKEFVHSKQLALDVATNEAKTADELAEAMIEAIGQTEADFGKAGAPKAATAAGLLEQPEPTEQSAQDVPPEEVEDVSSSGGAEESKQSPETTTIDPDDLPSLQTD